MEHRARKSRAVASRYMQTTKTSNQENQHIQARGSPVATTGAHVKSVTHPLGHHLKRRPSTSTPTTAGSSTRNATKQAAPQQLSRKQHTGAHMSKQTTSIPRPLRTRTVPYDATQPIHTSSVAHATEPMQASRVARTSRQVPSTSLRKPAVSSRFQRTTNTPQSSDPAVKGHSRNPKPAHPTTQYIRNPKPAHPTTATRCSRISNPAHPSASSTSLRPGKPQADPAKRPPERLTLGSVNNKLLQLRFVQLRRAQLFQEQSNTVRAVLRGEWSALESEKQHIVDRQIYLEHKQHRLDVEKVVASLVRRLEGFDNALVAHKSMTHIIANTLAETQDMLPIASSADRIVTEGNMAQLASSLTQLVETVRGHAGLSGSPGEREKVATSLRQNMENCMERLERLGTCKDLCREAEDKAIERISVNTQRIRAACGLRDA